MMFIDLKINKKFKLVRFNMERGTYSSYICVKVYPVRNKRYDIFNRYNLTTNRFVFIKPTSIVSEVYDE